MRSTRWISAFLTLVCLVALDGAAYAQREGRARPNPGAQPPGPGFEPGRFGPPGGPMGRPMGGPPEDFRPGGPPPGFPPPSPEDLDRLGVSDAQRSRIEKLHDESMRRMIRTEADLRISELDLRDLLEDDRPDADAIDAAIERVGGLRTALHKARVTEMLAVRSVLTPDQRTKLRRLAPPRPGR